MTNDCHYCYNSLLDDKLLTGKTAEMFNCAHLHLCTFISALTSLSFRFVLLGFCFFFFFSNLELAMFLVFPALQLPDQHSHFK